MIWTRLYKTTANLNTCEKSTRLFVRTYLESEDKAKSVCFLYVSFSLFFLGNNSLNFAQHVLIFSWPWLMRERWKKHWENKFTSLQNLEARQVFKALPSEWVPGVRVKSYKRSYKEGEQNAVIEIQCRE